MGQLPWINGGVNSCQLMETTRTAIVIGTMSETGAVATILGYVIVMKSDVKI